MYQAELEFLFIEAQSGNILAFEKLYKTCNQALFRYALRIAGDASIAEEATQEAWLYFAKHIRNINDSRAFRHWLYRQARWRTLDLLRASKSRREMEHSDTDIGEYDLPAEEFGEASDLRSAIEKLPAIEKQIMHLFYLDDLKITEIANIIEIPSGTVKSRLNRARKLLRTKLTEPIKRG